MREIPQDEMVTAGRQLYGRPHPRPPVVASPPPLSLPDCPDPRDRGDRGDDRGFRRRRRGLLWLTEEERFATVEYKIVGSTARARGDNAGVPSRGGLNHVIYAGTTYSCFQQQNSPDGSDCSNAVDKDNMA